MDKLIDEYIKTIPKVELHLHLEASCSRNTYLNMLAQDKKNDFSTILKRAPFEIFNHIVEKILCPNFDENIGILLTDLFKNRFKQNILYTQVQYSALKIHSETKLNVQQQFDIIIKHIKSIKMDAKYKNIYVDFILDIPRGNAAMYPYFNSYIDDIIKLQNIGEYKYYIRGIGIGGRLESQTMRSYHTVFFGKGFNANLLVIPHAGEFGNTDTMCANLKDTISYGTKRIGHGVRILECNANNVNPEQKKLVLDISISSNMKFITDGDQPKYKSLTDHPIKKLIENNYTVTLSTDDPAILFNSHGNNITLNDEYKLFATLYDQPLLKLYHITKIASDGFKNIPLGLSDGTEISFLKELQKIGHTDLINKYVEFQTQHINRLFTDSN
jgi:adenosine deaminase